MRYADFLKSRTTGRQSRSHASQSNREDNADKASREAEVARPKQHHYVTKAYLEGFLRPSEQHLMCYGRGRGPFRRSPEDLACQRNYYALKKDDGTWDDSIETLIGSTVEGPGLPIIQKLSSGNTRLTWQDRNRISLLIAFQEMRTPSARERTRAFSRALRERVSHDIKAADPHQNSVQIVGASGASTVTLDEMLKVHDEICDDHSMEIHRSLMGAALKLSELLRYMKFTVHYPTGDEEFITTDTPVIRVFRGTAPLGTGINRSDVEIRFPLSRNSISHFDARCEVNGRARAGTQGQAISTSTNSSRNSHRACDRFGGDCVQSSSCPARSSMAVCF